MKKKLNQGFTLVELVIIMVILGVLAAVAVPRLGNTIESSEEAQEEAVIGNFRSALQLYAMDQLAEYGNKDYPSDPFDALDVSWEYLFGDNRTFSNNTTDKLTDHSGRM